MSAPWLSPPDSQSFMQRNAYWHEVLDPRRLLASHAEIQKSKSLLEALGPRKTEKTQDEQVIEARKLCETSVHPDSGDVIPLLFRPPVYLLLGAPLVVTALTPHASVISSLIFQLPFQTYNAGFALFHNNRSLQEAKSQHPLHMAASVLYLSFLGAAPVLAMKRLGIHNPYSNIFFGRILPTPLYVLLGGLSVILMRFPEAEQAIQVVDQEGNVVGTSYKAAKKAVNETALSRSALLGVTALIPSLMSRAHIKTYPRMFALLHHLLALITFGAMIPISFSLFPQKGSIRREDLEEVLKKNTTEETLFYNRGL